jgi:hypothetical protein
MKSGAILAIVGIGAAIAALAGQGQPGSPPAAPPPVIPPIAPDYSAAETQFKSYIRELMIYWGSQGVQIPCSFEANCEYYAQTSNIPLATIRQWYAEVRGC